MRRSLGLLLCLAVTAGCGSANDPAPVPKSSSSNSVSKGTAPKKLRIAVIPKGTTLLIKAHYDNSKDNPFNPDPTATVRWGDQTWEEMLIGYFGTIEIETPTK